MKKFLKKVGKAMTRRVYLKIAIVIALLLIPKVAFAVEAIDVNEIMVQFMTIINTLLALLNVILWPVLLLIGGLMDNELILGAGMEDRLLSIWVNVRNIVNIAFVLLLLAIALYNVTGVGAEGGFSLKQALPKFVIGLIAVNFSFLIGKVILDASNILTTAVAAIPYSTEEFADAQTANNKLVRKLTLRTCAHTKIQDGELVEDKDKGPLCEGEGDSPLAGLLCGTHPDPNADGKTCYNGEFKAAAAQYFSRIDQRNIAMIMAVNMGGLTEFHLTPADEIPTYEQITINTLFSIVLFLVYGISYVALLVVLVARLVVLWVTLALSPLVALKYAIPESIISGLGGGAGEKMDLEKTFIKHAFAPTIIAFGMSIGFLMLDAFQSGGTNFLGSLGGTALSDFQGESQGTFVPGIDSIQALMISIATVGVVWMTVFAAASDTMASVVTDKIKGFAEKVGGWIATSPKYLPFMPIPIGGEGEEKYSVAALTQGIGAIPEHFRYTAAKQAQILGEAITGAGADREAIDLQHDVTRAGSHTNRLTVMGDAIKAKPSITNNEVNLRFLKETSQNIINNAPAGSFLGQKKGIIESELKNVNSIRKYQDFITRFAKEFTEMSPTEMAALIEKGKKGKKKT